MNAPAEILLIGARNQSLIALASQLRSLGVDPILVEIIAQAKERLSEKTPGLVVVDVETVANALDLVRELTFLYRGLPVLAAAVKGNVNEAREAIALGAVDYVLLPVEDDKLDSLVRNYSHRYFDPELGRGRRIITIVENMQRLLNQVRRVAQSNATVLIRGESGTGKELIARYLHQVSNRAKGPFVAINCAALPENLLESELFGHAKGAFTGALADRKGKFQQANGGTIFLDEISEMSLNLQAKLLRVLQEREVDPVGGRSPIALDVRVAASTNRDLQEWVQDGKFREDLFYRLNVFPVFLPPLRDRLKDIMLLANHFKKRFVVELGRNSIEFAEGAVAQLVSYRWPGNVRELENVMHRSLLMAEGSQVQAVDLMIDVPAWQPTKESNDSDQIQLSVGTTVRQMEEILIHRTLDEVNGNRTRAAELLGISIRTLRNKLNEYAAR